MTYEKTGELAGLNGTFNLYSVTGEDPDRLAAEAEQKRQTQTAAKEHERKQPTLLN